MAIIGHIDVVASMLWNAGTGFFRWSVNLSLNAESAGAGRRAFVVFWNLREDGLSIICLQGRAGKPIIITGPKKGFPAIFLGSQDKSRNTIQIKDSAYVAIRNLKLDGLGVADIDAVNARGVTHHITI